jgi:hypothetical protein
MKPLPVWPILALFCVVFGVMLAGAFSEAQLRGFYNIFWKDGGAIFAALIAVAAAAYAALPVYRQMKLQNAQAALALLPLVERDLDELKKAQRQLLDFQTQARSFALDLGRKTISAKGAHALVQSSKETMTVAETLTKHDMDQAEVLAGIFVNVVSLAIEVERAFITDVFGDQTLTPEAAAGLAETKAGEARRLYESIGPCSTAIFRTIRKTSEQIIRLRRVARDAIEH